jgi:hypothetical protein
MIAVILSLMSVLIILIGLRKQLVKQLPAFTKPLTENRSTDKSYPLRKVSRRRNWVTRQHPVLKSHAQKRQARPSVLPALLWWFRDGSSAPARRSWLLRCHDVRVGVVLRGRFSSEKLQNSVECLAEEIHKDAPCCAICYHFSKTNPVYRRFLA